MTTLTLLSVGTLKEAYLKDAVAEYAKRLSAYVRFESVSLKEARVANEDNPAEIKAALASEAQAILAKIPKDAFVITLCVEGKQMDSIALAKVLGDAKDRSGKIVCIIGSSHGLCDSVKAASHLRLSMSALTFPHQLAQVMLMESLYRSFTILAGKKYHK